MVRCMGWASITILSRDLHIKVNTEMGSIMDMVGLWTPTIILSTMESGGMGHVWAQQYRHFVCPLKEPHVSDSMISIFDPLDLLSIVRCGE